MIENQFLNDSPLEHISKELKNVLVVGMDGKAWTSQMLLAWVSPWIGELMSSLPLHMDHCIILPDIAWKDVSTFFNSLKLSWKQDGELVELLNIAPICQVLAKDEEIFQFSDEKILSIQSEADKKECVKLKNDQLDDYIKKESILLEASNGYIKNEELIKKSEYKADAPKVNRRCKVVCEQCGKQFCRKSNLKRHKQKWGENCNKELRNRKKSIPKKWDLECEQCGKHFSRKYNFERHKEIDCKKVTCEKCQRIFTSEWRLNRHKLSVNDSCDKIQNLSNMPPIKPVKPRKNKYSKGYIRKILKSPSLDFYNLDHVLQGMTLISCDECEKRYISSEDLAKHKVKIHPLIYSCNYCEYSGNEKRLLRKHHDSNHKDIPIPCELCNKICSDYRALSRHKRIVHDGIRFPCEKCSYKAKCSVSIRNHINAIHKKLTLSCDKCDKKYTHPRNLRQHQKSEHEGIIYLCDQCDYKGAQKRSLQNHIEKVHEGIIYQCDKCEYNGTNKRIFNSHIQKCHNETKEIGTQ